MKENDTASSVVPATGLVKSDKVVYQANFNISSNNQAGSAFRQNGYGYPASSFPTRMESAETYIKMAEKSLQSGSFLEMLGHGENALGLEPNHFLAHKYCAIALYETGQWEKAEESFRKVVALKPDYPEGYYNLGKALQQMLRLDEALTCYRKALELKPEFVEAYNNLLVILNEKGGFDEAELYFRKALAFDPNFAEIYSNIGNVFQKQGKSSEAIAAYRKALELRPELVEAYSNLGVVLCDQGKFDEAEFYYLKAVSLDPTFADTYQNMGNLFKTLGKRSEAIAAYRKAVECDPENNVVRSSLLHEKMHICEWGELESDIQDIRQIVREGDITAKNKITPFGFLTLPQVTAAEQKICAENWSRSISRTLLPLKKKLGFEFKCPASSKIHLAYLSADFHDHATSRLMVEVFEMHDRSRFFVTAYSYGPDDGSLMRQRVMQAFDQFVDISNLSLEDAARKIYADQAEILVDLKGYTADTRSAILALRPAPIQVNFLGYPGTMGADFADYLIADQFIIPSSGQEKNYAEKIIRMPDCYQPNDRTRPRLPEPKRKDLGLNEDGFVFCCFNQTYKITPQIFIIWCQLLKEVPNSQLWLFATHSSAEINLRKEAEKQGVAQDRLIMAPFMDSNDHLARLQCADLFLDTIPYNAHTTCSDALWMGLPVVTCAGETFASRVAGSLLTALGVPELITYTLEDYHDLALELATDIEKLAKIRNKIMDNRDTMPLFDTKRFTLNIEEAYQEMSDVHRRLSFSVSNN